MDVDPNGRIINKHLKYIGAITMKEEIIITEKIEKLADEEMKSVVGGEMSWLTDILA